MRRASIVIGLAVLAVGAAVAWGLWGGSGGAARLREICEAPKTRGFSGTVEITTFGADSSFAIRLELTHAAPDQTRARMAAWRRGDGEWTKPEHWDSWWERWFTKKKSPWGTWGSTWWRGGSRNVVRPILEPDLAAQNYRVAEAAGEPVAGRATRVLTLNPRHAGVPSYRLSVDRELSVPLAFEVRDGVGALRVSWRYVSFSPEAPPAENGDVRWKPHQKRILKPEELATYKPIEALQPRALPAGFKLREIRETKLVLIPMLVFSYTDGMSLITVTELNAAWPFGKLPEPVDGVPVVERTEKPGLATLRAHIGNTRVTVVGQVSSDHLMTLIRSLQP